MTTTPTTTTFTTWTMDQPCATMAWTPPRDDQVSLTVTTTTPSTTDTTTADLILIGVLAPTTDDDDDDDKSSQSKDPPPPVSFSTATAQALDTDGALTELAADHYQSFRNGATAGTTTPALRVLPPYAPTQRYVLLGWGREDASSSDVVAHKMGAAIATACHEAGGKVATCQVLFPTTVVEPSFFQHLSTAFYSALYRDNRFRSDVQTTAKHLTSVQLVVVPPSSDDSTDDAAVTTEAIRIGQIVARGCNLAKDIVNAPHNVLNSQSLADTARTIAAQSGCLECQIWGAAECEARGMGAYLGVARGSETEPQFIHLTYRPPGGDIKKTVGCVGKGLLFDTGGYNIKVAMMEKMKFDCGYVDYWQGDLAVALLCYLIGLRLHVFRVPISFLFNVSLYYRWRVQRRRRRARCGVGRGSSSTTRGRSSFHCCRLREYDQCQSHGSLRCLDGEQWQNH